MTIKNILNNKSVYFINLYICFFIFIAFAATNWKMGIISFKILSILFLTLFLFNEYETQTILFERFVIAVFTLLFNIFMLMNGKVYGQYEIVDILCCCILIVITAMFLIQNCQRIHLKVWIVKNIAILLVIMCFILLSVEVINSWLMWDSWQYYARGNTSILEMVKRFDANFSGVYDLYLASHATLGYSLWVLLFQMFIEGTASVHIADIILACISIYAYYQILRKLLGKLYSDKILCLATIPFAFSPFVLGIIGNINVDSATMYFSVIFIACILYHYEHLDLIFAFLLCFTKEPAIIYYVTFILAKIVCQYSVDCRFHFLGLFKYGFCNIVNYLYALPVLLWFFLYKINPNGGWGSESATAWNNKGMNCFGFNQSVMLTKLKHIVFLNFNWIFIVIIILGCIFLCSKHSKIDKEIRSILISIGIMGISVIVVGCVYITNVLPRYIVPIIPIIYLIATVVMGNLKNMYFVIYNVLIAILLLVQCFKVVDPVMNHIYSSKRQIGEEQALCEVGDRKRFDDYITYNRQNIYWSEAIVKVLEDSGYNGDMLITFQGNSRYELFGNLNCLWNIKTRKMEYYVESAGIPKDCTLLRTANISNVYEILKEMDNNYILYIIPKWQEINNDFISDKKIIEQGEVKNRGFDVQYIVMEAVYNFSIEGGSYIVSPKQQENLCIGTNGSNLLLQRESTTINLAVLNDKYYFNFDEYKVAMDVKYNKIDDNGTVWVWEINHSPAQQWLIEEVDGYYMISWRDHALTYDLNDNSVKLTPKTGADNQLWSFTQ